MTEQQAPAGPLGPDVAVTHILAVADPARSRDFWVNVLGAQLAPASLLAPGRDIQHTLPNGQHGWGGGGEADGGGGIGPGRG